MRAGLLLVGLGLFFCDSVKAQVSGEADFKKKFGLVDGYLYDGDYFKALPLAKELYAYDTTNANISYMLGTSLLGTDPDRNKAIHYLEQAVTLSTPSPMYKEGDYKEKSAPGVTYYNLARAYHFVYRFDDAISNYYNYRSFIDLNDAKEYAQVKHQIEYSENAKLLIEQPVSIKVQSLGPVINSKYEDYSPVISADGNTLIFTSRREGTTGGKLFLDGKYYEDIYIAKKERGKWTTPRSIGININTEGHEATIGLSPDGQQLFIYKDDNGDGNIYMSKLNGSEWSKPEKMGGEINTASWETHATVSADGQNLFLISNRSGGLGGRDIYKVSLLPDGTWGKAENLGPTINTQFDEEAPFFAADGKTLIFSSQGHNSMGGFDIFTSENIDGVWSTPVNIGYPINSPEDDVFFVTTPDGHFAYYSSRMEGGMGEKDIYLIELSEKKKESLTVMKGVVILENSSEIIANIVVSDARTNAVTGIYKPNKTSGSYIFILQPGAEYNVSYECDGYQAKTDKIVVPENSSYAEITKAVMLDPIVCGKQVGQVEEQKEVVLSENKQVAELNELEAQLLAEENALKAKQEEAARIAEKKKAEQLAAAKAAEEKKLADEAAVKAKAEEARLAEVKRKADEIAVKAKAEEERLAAEKKKADELATANKTAEEKKLAEEAAVKAKAEETARLAEEKRKADEAAAKAKAEEERLAAEKKKAEELAAAKTAEEKKLAQEAAIKVKAEETARLAEEKRKADEAAANAKAEEARLAAEKKKAEELAAANKAAEEKKLAEEAAVKAEAEETARLAEEKRKADEIAAKAKAEEERLAAEKKKAEELAAAKAAAEKKLAEEAAAKAKAEEAARIAEEKRKADEVAKAEAEEKARLAAEKKKADELAAQKKKLFEDSLVARKNEIIKRLEELKKLQTQKTVEEAETAKEQLAKEALEKQKQQRKAEEDAMLAEQKRAEEETAKKAKQEEQRKAAEKAAEEKRNAEEAVAKQKAAEEAKQQAQALADSKSIEELKKMNQTLIAENEQLKKQIAESNKKIDQLTSQVEQQNQNYRELLAKFEELQKQQKLQKALEKKTDFESFTKGEAVVLKNIFFDYNLSIIRKESETELKRLYKYLLDNPDIKMEVSGHTDSHGNDEYNIQLSRDRANAVVRYLTRNGIDANRLKSVGMGEKQPIAINENPDGTDNPEGRQLNRRIEIKILNSEGKNVKIENIDVPTGLKPKS